MCCLSDQLAIPATVPDMTVFAPTQTKPNQTAPIRGKPHQNKFFMQSATTKFFHVSFSIKKRGNDWESYCEIGAKTSRFFAPISSISQYLAPVRSNFFPFF
jgi:hypothetical protein